MSISDGYYDDEYLDNFSDDEPLSISSWEEYAEKYGEDNAVAGMLEEDDWLNYEAGLVNPE